MTRVKEPQRILKFNRSTSNSELSLSVCRLVDWLGILVSYHAISPGRGRRRRLIPAATGNRMLGGIEQEQSAVPVCKDVVRLQPGRKDFSLAHDEKFGGVKRAVSTVADRAVDWKSIGLR